MKETTVKINGMMCGMCEAHINDAIRKNFDVKKVKASKSKKNAVILSDEDLDASKLKDVINETGYEYVSVESKEYTKKGLFGF